MVALGILLVAAVVAGVRYAARRRRARHGPLPPAEAGPGSLGLSETQVAQVRHEGAKRLPGQKW